MLHAFPREEYESRWRKAWSAMERLDVDALLLTTREDVQYFTGFDTFGWYGAPIVVALARKQEPILVLPLHELGNAEQTASAGVFRTWGSFDADERDRIDPVDLAIRAIRSTGIKGTVGTELASRSGLTPSALERLVQASPDFRFTDCGEVIAEVRLVKTPLEIAVIRRACEVTCAGYEAGLQMIRLGVTEAAVARAMWMRMIEEGCDLPDHCGHIIARGGPDRNRCFGAVAIEKPLELGDIVKLDGGARYRSYWCDMSRFAAIGGPTPEQRAMFEADLAASQAMVAAAKPGLTFADVFRKGLEVIEHAGFGPLSMSRSDTIFGHSLGMGIHEPPFVSAMSNRPLEPGMVLALEPQLNAYPPDFRIAVFSVEDTVLITETGSEVLTPLRRDLWVVS